MGKAEFKVTIDPSKCSGCSVLVCVGVCPQGILEAGGDGKPRVVDVSSCTVCGVCVNLCPSKAITLNSSRSPKKSSR